jgi:hypothetical protein
MAEFLKYFPKSKALEQITKNMIKKSSPEAVTLIEGLTDGAMNGDILGSISKAADNTLKQNLLDTIRKNFITIVNEFDKKLNEENGEITIFTIKLLNEFQTNFPSQDIQNILDKLKNILLEMKNKNTETKTEPKQQGGQSITCTDNTIKLSETNEIVDFVNKAFEKYICQLNHPERIEELYDILHGRIIHNFQSQMDDVFLQIKEKNDEKQSGGFNTASVFNSATSFMPKKTDLIKNFTDISKESVSATNSTIDTQADSDTLVKDTYKKLLEKILNKSIKYESKTIAYKLHNLTKTIFDDYFPDLTSNINVYCNTVIQQNELIGGKSLSLGNLGNLGKKITSFASKASDAASKVSNVVNKASDAASKVSNVVNKANDAASKASDAASNVFNKINDSSKTESTNGISHDDVRPDMQKKTENTKPPDELISTPTTTPSENSSSKIGNVKEIKTQKELEFFMVRTLNAMFCKAIVNKLIDFSKIYRDNCQLKITTLLNTAPTQSQSAVPTTVGGKKRLTRKRRILRKKTKNAVTKKR